MNGRKRETDMRKVNEIREGRRKDVEMVRKEKKRERRIDISRAEWRSEEEERRW